MSREKEIKNLRIKKIQKLKEMGMMAYPDPAETTPGCDLETVRENFSTWENEGKELKLTGRIMTKRGAGKIAFASIFHNGYKFQVVLQADILGKEKMKIFDKLFDMGDFAIFQGTLFTTQKGEPSLKVSDFKMAGKSLLPLPEKWHGLQDIEEKYRKRYLDILADKKSFQKFKIRAEFIKLIRRILDEEGMLEIETPILQNQASGAMAETFKTFHNDYKMEMVLRISFEAEHKMVMAGGYSGVYEIGKDFRNEGSDPTHHQEFTMLEFYQAFRGLEWNMNLTEKILRESLKLVGKDVLEIKNKDGSVVKVDFTGEWPRVKFMDLIREYAKIDPATASREELEAKAIELGDDPKEVKKISMGNLLDSIYKKSARKNIINPTFVMNYPGEMKPLAIQNEDGTAEMTQLVIAGAEITNQYAELVDPLIQRKLLEEQVKAKAGGDAEAMDMNEAFLTAMEYGMPPMTGTGIGIDRWISILTEESNIRDVILFPIIKPA